MAATRSVPFAALAFALLLLEALSRGPWRWPRAAAPLATTAAAITVVAAGFTAGAPAAEDREPRGGSVEAIDLAAARVRARPDDARAQIELGLASLEAGRNEDAARAFETATVFAQSPAIAAVAYYDLGVAAFALGDVNAARDAYFAALELDPADERARFNLEWTLGSAQAPEATLPPETEPDAVETRDTPSGADDARESVPEIPEMSAAQRRRWLERAADDPTHWLRSAAGDPEGPSARAARPAW